MQPLDIIAAFAVGLSILSPNLAGNYMAAADAIRDTTENLVVITAAIIVAGAANTVLS
jgi:hypothetical protein